MTKVRRGRQTRKGRAQCGVFALPCRSGFEEICSLLLACSTAEGRFSLSYCNYTLIQVRICTHEALLRAASSRPRRWKQERTCGFPKPASGRAGAWGDHGARP